MNLKKIELIIQTGFNSLDEVLKQHRQQDCKIAKIFFFIRWLWDKNVSKTEIKSYVFLSINFHNLQINFHFPLTLIYTNF